MKALKLLAALQLASTSALAEQHYQEVFQAGPTAALETLTETSDTASASDLFALGGAHFLIAIERAYQTRFDFGLTQPTPGVLTDVPFLRSTIPTNPNPQDFEPAVIDRIFQNAIDDLENARLWLDRVEDTDAVSVRLDLTELWIDVNGDGQQNPGEALAESMAVAMGQAGLVGSDAPASMKVQFDTADAAWLSAYAHTLSGACEAILAMDPSGAVQTVLEGSAKMESLRGDETTEFLWLQPAELPTFDVAMAVFKTLEGPLDANRTRRAHQHFLDAIDDNKVFWQRLREEGDDTLELIPNSNQTSALPLIFPEGIDSAWQAVLSDVEDILNGEILIPHWRLGSSAGLNLKSLFMNPPDIDVFGMFHGFALASYAEKGTLARLESLAELDRVTGGNSGIFAITLN